MGAADPGCVAGRLTELVLEVGEGLLVVSDGPVQQASLAPAEAVGGQLLMCVEELDGVGAVEGTLGDEVLGIRPSWGGSVRRPCVRQIAVGAVMLRGWWLAGVGGRCGELVECEVLASRLLERGGDGQHCVGLGFKGGVEVVGEGVVADGEVEAVVELAAAHRDVAPFFVEVVGG